MAISLRDLSKRLVNRLALPLPGGDAHEPFRAIPVGDVKPLFEHGIPPRPGGVIILLYEDEGRIMFPLIKRAEYLGAHSGQISLPGGKAEPGEEAIDTAMRECEEEIGVKADQLTVIGKLSEFYVMPSNFIVTPVIATMDYKPFFKPDPYEVVRVLEGSVEDIIREEAMKQKGILAAGKYPMMAPHFEIDNEIVWGATAMMLNEFRMMVREVMG
jgi:8-oxo-dGTP pyrophosphatase MutT (NUDIX family)